MLEEKPQLRREESESVWVGLVNITVMWKKALEHLARSILRGLKKSVIVRH